MRWPIRNQILLPLTALQVVVVSVVTAWAAWTAADRVRDDATQRMANVRDLLQRATFPLTPGVLGQIRLLSGAEYALFDDAGRPTFSTLHDAAGGPDDLQSAGAVAARLGVHDVQVNDRTYGAEWILAPRTAGAPVQLLVLHPRDRLRQLQQDAIAGPLLTGGWILLLTVLATTWVSHRIGRRMQRIERHAARIAGGDFAPVELPRRIDEIRDLSQSVNQMAEGLQQLTGSIRTHERSLLVSQIAAGLAHQLRNALTGIRMAVQVHQRRCPAREDASLDVALAQLSLTEQQIRGLLSLTRGEHRSIMPGPATALLNEIATMIEPVCEHRRIAFTYNADCDRAAIVADADAFRSAVLNLCMNGVEAAGRPGELSLVARQSAGMLEVAVSDNGAGVPPRIRDSLFTPFVTTKPEGVGLGLALARSAAEDLGGGVELCRDNQRTVFTFRCRIQSPPMLAS
ncbi:MAG: HAMP domain-containing histidine kinase [Planctomycetaceae bacterium]|nr:HAMP domain-containing histidine kinase [Planctomycetaceae bacterium]